MRTLSVAPYKRAFLAIRPRLTELHLELLRVNYGSPNHTVSVEDMAKAVGRRKIQGIYGRLGRLLCEELDYTPTMMDKGKPVLTQVLADAPEHRSHTSWEWTLRPQVILALQGLGWVDHTSPKNAYVLIWNPAELPWKEEEYAREVKTTAAGSFFLAWIPTDLKSPKEMVGMRPGAKL